jgi:hypothetical protein
LIVETNEPYQAGSIFSEHLRTVLDELQRTLASKPTIGDDLRDALERDQQRLLGPLRSFLDQLRFPPAGAPQPTLPIAAPIIPDLEISLTRLATAITRRAHGVLSDEHVRALKDLLSDPHPDFLAVMDRHQSEHAHSDLLRWLLDQRCAPTVAPAALRRMVEVFADRDQWHERLAGACRSDAINVRREFAIEAPDGDGHNFLDIMISGGAHGSDPKSHGFIIVIENKVGAAEGEDQTSRYWRWLDAKPAGVRRAAFFLTPRGTLPRCPHFTPISYLQLLACLLEAATHEPLRPAERHVLAGYAKTMKASILRAELRALTEEV